MALGNERVRADNFKQFDCVADFSDHHFYVQSKSKQKKNGGDGGAVVNNKITVKRIMKEWEILEKSLPESIFVRVYEGRIDLLRAAIIGARKTPYHNGVFFFDLRFPPDYPNSPPLVHYRSFGLRLNPNLYATGYVCLSLLNTWAGTGAERWRPEKSTVLQVLLSLQGLVLNEKPYFNEPGIKPAWSWESYNADVFILSCKTMLFQLRNPAKNFEALIAGHFRGNAGFILRACLEYLEGRVRVGFFNGEAGADAPVYSKKKKIKVSGKFKYAVAELYQQLYKAFNGVGASLIGLPEKINVNRTPAGGIIGKLKSFWKKLTA